jgi:CRP/FNR family transcriptional regulator, cyclic AMP receptor protein
MVLFLCNYSGETHGPNLSHLTDIFRGSASHLRLNSYVSIKIFKQAMSMETMDTTHTSGTPQPAEKMKYLSELAVFQDLTPREMEELNRITTMSTVTKGRVFYRPEEPGEVLFILKEGRVQLYRISPEGKKLVITTLGPHTLFGEMALLGTKMHNTFAEAVDDCLICVMSRTDLERLILSKPQVALRILEITGKRLREAEERLESMAFKGIPARLASLLLRLADEQGTDDVRGLTHQDLAESVGTYRETATQVLNDLKTQGLIEIGRKRIKILNKEELLEVSEG